MIAAALAGGEERLRELWRRDDDLKKTVRWAFTLPDDRLQSALLGVLNAVGPEGAGFVKELLTDDALSELVKRRAVLLLSRMGEPMPYVLTYRRRITQVQCVPKEMAGVPQWRSFLKLFLMEAGHWGSSRDAAFFAADMYKALPRDLREEAAGEKALQWVKAFEVLFLHMKGRERDIEKVVRHLPISVRRILRVIRLIERACPADLYMMKGENT